jgi:hypothetical protein
MKEEFTPLLPAVQAKCCPMQAGTDMLFEMIPAYLEFFGFGTATPRRCAPWRGFPADPDQSHWAVTL